MSIFDLVFRAAYLGGLTLAPGFLSPDPAPATTGLALLGLSVLVIPIGLTIRLRRAALSLEALAAAIAWPVTAVALVLIAKAHSGSGAPLLGGYYAAAPFVWLSLALTAASLAGHFLGTNWKNKRVGAAVIVLGIGIFLFRSAHELIASPALMWEAVLAEDPSNERAFSEVFSAKKIDRALLASTADACLARHPAACACLIGRADVRLRGGDHAGASKDAQAASAAGCALDNPVAGSTLREVLASSLAQGQDWDGAARVLEGAPASRVSSRLLVAQALVLQGRGDASGAEAMAHRALEAPDAALASRDANLLIASLLIARGEPAAARPILTELGQTDPNDADVGYDLALLDDLGGNFNGAREGYLRVLRAHPDYRAARYNVAMLTLRQGSISEARHHASKFAEAWPSDPRAPELLRLTGAGPGAN